MWARPSVHTRSRRSSTRSAPSRNVAASRPDSTPLHWRDLAGDTPLEQAKTLLALVGLATIVLGGALRIAR